MSFPVPLVQSPSFKFERGNECPTPASTITKLSLVPFKANVVILSLLGSASASLIESVTVPPPLDKVIFKPTLEITCNSFKESKSPVFEIVFPVISIPAPPINPPAVPSCAIIFQDDPSQTKD